MLVALLVAFVVRGDTNVNVDVTPTEVERGNAFYVTVQAQLSSSNFTLEIVDQRGGTLTITNRTDANGFWQNQVGVFLDFGTYRVLVTLYNTTGEVAGFAQATFTVVCRGVCVSEQLNYLFGQFAVSIADYIARITILLFVAYAGVEVPRTAAWIYRGHKKAVAEHRPSFLTLLAYPFASVRSFIAPSRQGTLPRANERIALDEARRRVLDQLHHATSERYLTYDPEHVETLKGLMADLGKVTERERAISAMPPHVYHKFEAMPMQLQDSYDEIVGPEPPPANVVRRAKRHVVIGGVIALVLGIPALVVNLMYALNSFLGIRPLETLWRPWMEPYSATQISVVAASVSLATFSYFFARVRKYLMLRSGVA